jgi:hypothetical protein
VLRYVSPMVIRLVSVSDRTDFPGLHELFHAILGWSGDLGYIVRVHGQEFNSFRRSTRSKALRDFQLHRQEKFLYVCDVMDLWEWDVRVLDIQPGIEDDHSPWCLGGRGAAPPEHCGGPRGYRLMLKRQQQGSAIAEPASVEATIQMLASAHPDQSARTWDLLRETFNEGWKSIDRRLGQYGPLEPNRFSLKEANERLSVLLKSGSLRP